jgi:hypothetical protein
MSDKSAVPDSMQAVPGGGSTMVGNLSRKYMAHPLPRSLLKLLPGWSAADTLLQRRADEMRQHQIETFFDALVEGTIGLTEQTIDSQEFLFCYFRTLKASLLTRRSEKLRLLGSLLAGAARNPLLAASDEYDELLSAIDDVSGREFEALSLVEGYQKRNGVGESLVDTEGNRPPPLDKIGRYWKALRDDVCQRLNLSHAEFDAFMARIERTGFYIRITGSFTDYYGDMGRTTPLYEKLKHILEIPHKESAA